MTRLLLISLTLASLSACKERPRFTYTRSGGTEVKCLNWIESGCGMDLYYCDDGKIYKCQTNVQTTGDEL